MCPSYMAAPHVTGIAALLRSQEPFLDYAVVKAAILDTVDEIPSVADKMVSGGRVNALNALCSVNALAGDFNYDKALDLADAVLALQIISGEASEKAVCKEAEVNSDGRIGLEEIIYILQVIAGLK
jgi:subtilisin family serine protease